MDTPRPASEQLAKIQAGLKYLSDPTWLALDPDADLGPDLAAAVDLLERFGVNFNTPDPARGAARTFAGRVAGSQAKANIEDLTLALLNALENALADAVAAGATDARLIRTADFGNNGVVPARLSPDLPVAFVGLLDCLPAGHPVRALPWPPYRHSTLQDGKPAVILGPAVATVTGQTYPRAFYTVRAAMEVTAFWADRQVQAERDRAERERQAEIEARRRFWNSPLGIREREMRALERLREKGKLPQEVNEAPAVLAPDGQPYRTGGV
jgi:hypothetical protein